MNCTGGVSWLILLPMFFGIDFKNPVMPAAGPNVKTAGLMIEAAETGSGAVVSKTFSVKPADDPRPTMKKTVAGGLLNCENLAGRHI